MLWLTIKKEIIHNVLSFRVIVTSPFKVTFQCFV